MKPSPFTPSGSRRAPARRRALVGLAGLAAAVLLSGCQVDNTPKGYDDGNGVVKTNFLATCTGKIPNASTTVILATDDACTCAFNVFQSQVPYSGDDRARIGTSYPADAPTFEELEKSLANEPSKYNDLPQSVRDNVAKCKSQGATGPVAPTGSAPATTATTTPGTTTGTAPS